MSLIETNQSICLSSLARGAELWPWPGDLEPPTSLMLANMAAIRVAYWSANHGDRACFVAPNVFLIISSDVAGLFGEGAQGWALYSCQVYLAGTMIVCRVDLLVSVQLVGFASSAKLCECLSCPLYALLNKAVLSKCALSMGVLSKRVTSSGTGRREDWGRGHSLKLVIPLHFMSCKKTPNDAVTSQRQSQFTPKMKANAVPRLLSSLVWIDQYN